MKKQPLSTNDQIKAFQAQNKLFEILLKMTRASSEQTLLKTTMREALKVVTSLSGSTNGSLFLLNNDGIVTDSIITRDDVSKEKRSCLIGSVLDGGLAGWVKQHLEIGIINDTRTDSRWFSFKDQPYTVGSAVAIPILRHHSLFGILTLMHPKTNHFGEEAVSLIRMTADQMAVAIENAQLYSKLEDSYKKLEKAKKSIERYSEALTGELMKGRKIQKDFLPYEMPELTGCCIEAYFHPAMQLSGDFYDFFALPEERLGIVIADVSDKGVGSALFMALARSLIRIFSSYPKDKNHCWGKTLESPETRFILSAVSHTNAYLAREHGNQAMFITIFFGVFDNSTGLLSYVNAGHEPLMIINHTGIKAALKPTGPAIGVFPDIDYEPQSMKLEPGETLFGFTDGVTEARSSDDELYTRKRLEETVETAIGKSGKDFLNAIKNDIFTFIDNAPQADDITMIVLQKA